MSRIQKLFPPSHICFCSAVRFQRRDAYAAVMSVLFDSIDIVYSVVGGFDVVTSANNLG
jgi:hypothetical protein